MSIFGGFQQQLDAIPAPAPARRGFFGGSFDPLRFSPMSGSDRLMALGALLSDVGGGTSENSQALMARRQQQQLLAQRQQALAGLGSALGGAPGVSQGGASAPPGGGSIPSMRDALPALFRAASAGVDISDYVTALDKAQPDMRVDNGVAYDARRVRPGERIGVNLSNVNGHAIDMQDPRNADRFIPQVGEGQELLYDSQGNPTVRNIPGYSQGRAETEGGIARARAVGTAPYEFVNVPTPSGAPAVISRADAANGVFTGQSPAAAAQARIEAEGQASANVQLAQRQREAPARIARYEEALGLIPLAITGPLANQRLAAARALALAGNQDAQRQVTATETYQNLVNRDVGALIKEMVGSANISNTDREFAQRVAGGEIALTPQTLTRIVQIELERQRSYADGRQPGTAARHQEGRPRARNPQTGAVVEFDGSQWVPVR